MKKNYVHPAIAALVPNTRDIITASSVLDTLDKIEPSRGSDPSMEDNIDL